MATAKKKSKPEALHKKNDIVLLECRYMGITSYELGKVVSCTPTKLKLEHLSETTFVPDSMRYRCMSSIDSVTGFNIYVFDLATNGLAE